MIDPGYQQVYVSIGTAAVLGLNDAKVDVAPTTAYLMLGGRCAMNCAFCAQARESHASALSLSRVTWPAYPLGEVVHRIALAYHRRELRRACLQVTFTRQAFRQTLHVVQAIRAACNIPVDAAILPRDMDEVRQLIEAGVEHIGFGLDAACRRVFEQVKGGNWERSIEMIRQASSTFPGRVAVHLIVGLGETERDMAEMIQRMHDWGVTVGLFAFTPVRGTIMESYPPPPLDQYRRMQVVRYLIAHDMATWEQFVFDEAGRLIHIDIEGWRELVSDGRAFETSGCPDCNRPYYNERPGGTMYNYPRRLTPAEIAEALAELQMDSAPAHLNARDIRPH